MRTYHKCIGRSPWGLSITRAQKQGANMGGDIFVCRSGGLMVHKNSLMEAHTIGVVSFPYLSTSHSGH